MTLHVQPSADASASATLGDDTAARHLAQTRADAVLGLGRIIRGAVYLAARVRISDNCVLQNLELAYRPENRRHGGVCAGNPDSRLEPAGLACGGGYGRYQSTRARKSARIRRQASFGTRVKPRPPCRRARYRLRPTHGSLLGEYLEMLDPAYRGRVKDTIFPVDLDAHRELERVGTARHWMLFCVDELRATCFQPYEVGSEADCSAFQANDAEYPTKDEVHDLNVRAMTARLKRQDAISYVSITNHRFSINVSGT